MTPRERAIEAMRNWKADDGTCTDEMLDLVTAHVLAEMRKAETSGERDFKLAHDEATKQIAALIAKEHEIARARDAALAMVREMEAELEEAKRQWKWWQEGRTIDFNAGAADMRERAAKELERVSPVPHATRATETTLQMVAARIRALPLSSEEEKTNG